MSGQIGLTRCGHLTCLFSQTKLNYTLLSPSYNRLSARKSYRFNLSHLRIENVRTAFCLGCTVWRRARLLLRICCAQVLQQHCADRQRQTAEWVRCLVRGGRCHCQYHSVIAIAPADTPSLGCSTGHLAEWRAFSEHAAARPLSMGNSCSRAGTGNCSNYAN